MICRDDDFHRKSVKPVGGLAGVVTHGINYPTKDPGKASSWWNTKWCSFVLGWGNYKWSFKKKIVFTCGPLWGVKSTREKQREEGGDILQGVLTNHYISFLIYMIWSFIKFVSSSQRQNLMRSLVAVEQGLLLAVHLWVGHAKSLPLTSNFDCLKFNLSWICFVWKQMADNNFVAYHPLFNGVCGNSSKEHPTIFWIQLEGNHCLKEKVCRNMNSLFVVLSTNTDIWYFRPL